MPAHYSSAAERGFTLIELLVGIGIVGLLSSIVIVAINPSKQLDDARDAERMLNSRTIEKALTQYVLDEWSAGDIAGQSVTLVEGAANAVPVCSQGSEAEDCLSVDFLVPDYIAAIPGDAAMTDPSYSGFCIYLSSARYQVFSLALMPEGAACGGMEAMMDGGGEGDSEEAPSSVDSETQEGEATESSVQTSASAASSSSSLPPEPPVEQSMEG